MRCPSPGSRSGRTSAPRWLRRSSPRGRRTRRSSLSAGRSSAESCSNRSRGCSEGRCGRAWERFPASTSSTRWPGAVLGLAAGVLICWAVGAVLLYLPGQSELRRSVQESAILSRINEEFPPERLLETLERVDPIGVVIGPPAIVPPPDTTIASNPRVVLAATSVVRVTGLACGLGIEGSGWIVRPGLVVTNAHVVAGIRKPHVDRRAGAGLDADRRRFRRGRRSCGAAREGSPRPPAAACRPGARDGGRARRLPGERPPDPDARPARRNGKSAVPGCLWTRARSSDPRRRSEVPCAPGSPAARRSTLGDECWRPCSPGVPGKWAVTGFRRRSYATCSSR